LIVRDEEQSEIGGLILPDQAQVRPATGKIISVGDKVTDKNIEVGKTGVWNKNVGWEIEIGEQSLTVIYAGEKDSQLIAVF
jgi:co-chaperonin GroES (HSP10)